MVLWIVGIIGILLLLCLWWLFVSYQQGYRLHLQHQHWYRYPKRTGTLQLFNDGYELYERLFHDLKEATATIEVQFFSACTDRICMEFYELIKGKAAEGVAVRLLLDWYGAKKVTAAVVADLQAHGVLVAFSNRPTWPYVLFTALTRNHRKITVIDGVIGYVGGFNLGEECLGHSPKLGYWRDYHLRITGQAVNDLRHRFYRDWQSHHPDKTIFTPVAPALSAGYAMRLESTNGAHLHDAFASLIRQAQKELVICSPYFIPGKELTDSLKAALARGVRVSLLLPMKADYQLVQDASFRYLKELLPAGLNVYRFYEGFCHGKVIIVDDTICDIGSGNFNKRSFYLNDEMNCFITTPSFIRKVKATIEEDLHRSEPFTLQDLKQRPLMGRIFREPLARMIEKFL
ncbi:phospholipase D/transphosphatidylase [Fictibacillus macauensis ZFHKF-1]|uniref:Phospholipase D/transphosphatidylase n=1 Tax=Fictibacillus macauensis ZFHKF-1 TaxID=1196324 RepID=I8J3A9_9BACL|nr:phospholipase D-like domain-containing protein [Fictibacillus macauensis]EIT86246.1 phospholipase D/transphosphatidylase [Fictibacillus macauensis ZFHKF-1]